MVQDFSGISETKTLVYYSLIIFDSIGFDFTQDQKTNFLKMHGFPADQVPEILRLGEKLSQNLELFKLNL